MPKYNDKFLKFDAFSIKLAIIEKLSEESDFTDHLFEGSNLTAIIDVFSHMYEVMTYYINHGSSEAMFTDSKLYENMNRIVKMIGYNPLGFINPKCTVTYYNKPGITQIFEDDIYQKDISRYTSIDTGQTDTRGKPIHYSFVDRVTLNNDNNPQSMVNNLDLINGKWKTYSTTFLAQGIPFEEFTLDQLILDITNKDVNYVSHPFVNIFVKRVDILGNAKYIEFSPISDGVVFGNRDGISGPESQFFELRINEDKFYTIRFGDGINGKKLKKNDEIFVVYLEGNGPDGEIAINTINAPGKLKWGIQGIDETTFLKMINVNCPLVLVTPEESNKIIFQNIVASTKFKNLETVDEIRQTAPNWFKGSGRLVTLKDYETYIRRTQAADITSVRVMNNWYYAASFYKWLYKYDELTSRIRAFGYYFADSCDFNNVYIWAKFKYDNINVAHILDSMQDIKTLTAEPIIQKAIESYFFPSLNFNESEDLPIGYNNNRYDFKDWDPNIENWIEIKQDKNAYISAEKIKAQVVNSITSFFDNEINSMGMKVDISELYGILMKIPGVSEIKTAFRVHESLPSSTVYFNGLSFAKWTMSIIEGKDLEMTRGVTQLEEFQFPILHKLNLAKRIKIVSESLGQATVEY